MSTVDYVLEIWPGRALTAITPNTIHFNIAGERRFGTADEANGFLETWRNHFFGMHTLTIGERERQKGAV
jgi:hypothetical protein